MTKQRRATAVTHGVPAWLMWLVAALGVPFQFALQSTPNVMIAGLTHDLAITQATVGFLTSNFFYTYLFFQIPAGLLVDRFGVRRVLSGSLALAALTCLLFALAPHFSIASVSRLLMGLVTAPCVPAIMFLSAKRFSPHRFALLAGLAESIGMLGGALGEAILGSVVMSIGWRGSMLGCAIVGLLIAGLMWACVRDQSVGGEEISATPRLKEVARGFIAVMQSRQVWIIVVYGGLIFALLPALAGLWIVPIMQQAYGLSIQHAALASAVMFFGTALGLPVWGTLSERIGRRKPVLWLATGLSMLLVSGFTFGPRLPLVWAYVLLGMVGFVSAVYVLAFALVREQTAKHVRASAMGLTNMMSMMIGAPLLQPLIGVILDQHALYRYALIPLVVCLGLALLLIWFIQETHCKEQRATV